MKLIPGDLSKRDAHELVMSAIVPRPIAFVSTVGQGGIFNLAPFSCFAPLGAKPALIALHATRKRNGDKKDTLQNIEFSKDFVVNVVTEKLAEVMNQAAAGYPPDVDEFRMVGLTPVESDLIRSPRVAESPVNMECRLVQVLEFGDVSAGGHLIIGEIVLVHVRDDLWNGEDIEITGLKPIGRIGRQLYCRVTDMFEMKRPADLSLE